MRSVVDLNVVMRRIPVLLSIACSGLPFFHIISQKVRFSVKKNVTERKMCFDFQYNLCLKLYHAKKN